MEVVAMEVAWTESLPPGVVVPMPMSPGEMILSPTLMEPPDTMVLPSTVRSPVIEVPPPETVRPEEKVPEVPVIVVPVIEVPEKEEEPEMVAPEIVGLVMIVLLSESIFWESEIMERIEERLGAGAEGAELELPTEASWLKRAVSLATSAFSCSGVTKLRVAPVVVMIRSITGLVM